MKNSVLLLALLLTACASDFRIKWGGATEKPEGIVKEQRKIDAKPQPVESQRPIPKAQQPASSDQVVPPKRREHNIEED